MEIECFKIVLCIDFVILIDTKQFKNIFRKNGTTSIQRLGNINVICDVYNCIMHINISQVNTQPGPRTGQGGRKIKLVFSPGWRSYCSEEV